MKRLPIVLLGLMVISSLFFTSISYANDGDPSGSSGSGGDGTGAHKCDYNLCSTYGASWKWYPTDSDYVKIPGTVNGYNEWSPGYATNTEIVGCGAEGGYWRYALVAERTIDKARTTNFTDTGEQWRVYKGDQVGTLGIGAGGAGGQFTSKMLGGGTTYRDENISWDAIKQIYLDSKAANPAKFWRNWDEFSDLGWFCAPNPDIHYLSESNVSSGSNLGKTGVVERGSADGGTVTINTGESVPLVFSHNIYSSAEAKNVDWQVVRSVDMKVNGINIKIPNGIFGGLGGVYYDIPSYTEGSYSGKANLTVNGSFGGDATYTADPRPYSDGSRLFLARDNYSSIIFKVAGTYTFCEAMNIGATPVQYTKACMTFEVKQKLCVPGSPECPDDTPCVPGSPECPDDTPLEYCKKWEPSSYTNSDTSEARTSVISAVHTNLAKYSDWTLSNGLSESAFSGSPVYAKPNDTLSWLHCYYPGVQRMYNKSEVNIDYTLCPKTRTDDYINNVLSLWENKFEITQREMRPANASGVKSYTSGDDEKRYWGVNEYKVETNNYSRAGKSLVEKNTSGSPQWVEIYSVHDSECCEECPCEEGDCGCCDRDSITFNRYHVDTSSAEDAAMVKVPYNYVNTIRVDIDRSNSNVVYAGEKVTVNSATVSVIPKYNAVTEGTYATNVDGGEAKLVAYVSDRDQTGNPSAVDNPAGSSSTVNPQPGYGSHGSDLCGAINSYEDCREIDDERKTFNDPEVLSGKTDPMFKNRSYNVFDVSAGKWYCVVAAVYPASSGEDTNMKGSSGNAGNDSWSLSTPQCVQIAKKPSLQIWGNSLYSAGKVITSTTEKSVVAGYHDFDSGYSGAAANNSKNRTVFGSWVEQAAIIPSSYYKGFASGAATGGYTTNPNLFGGTGGLTDVIGLGGSHEGYSINYCKYRVPLTITNTDCNDAVKNKSVSSTTPTDKSSLISQFMLERSQVQNAEFEYTDEYETISDFVSSELGGSNVIPIGTTWVINSERNFEIDQNITYPNERYFIMSEIPKLIIYAAGNITIDCNVERVDAVLIADGDVNTCPDLWSGYNSGYDTTTIIKEPLKNASHQLKIFGSVITDTLTASRTYGAAAGAESNTPAEIIDYDSTLYLWGVSRANVGASGKTDISFQQELPPRY